MDTIIKTQIIDLIHREVIPAIGCTEPIAVALAGRKSGGSAWGCKPEKIEVLSERQYPEECHGSRNPGDWHGGVAYRYRFGIDHR